MFNKDFYPTPPDVINEMLMGIDVRDKVFLEPSAGKGNIVDALDQRGASQVLTFEKEPELAYIVSDKSTFLGNDFLTCTPEQVSHVDYIVMNPPFNADEKHILHAWEVAPEGCQIISLCPSATLDNTKYSHREQLGQIIKEYGEATDLGDCFTQAERKTGVEVSLVKLFKPVISKDFDYEGFYMDVDEEVQANGLMRYSEVQSIVSRYVSALKCFDEFQTISERMNSLVSPIGLKEGFAFRFSYNETVTTKEEFAKKLQKRSWRHLFDKMNMAKFVTSGVMSDINKFIETQSKYPFTMKNIYRMLEIIISGRKNIMERALVEAFDKITRHYDENRYHIEGWKTNSHYMINRKFILPFITEMGWSGELTFKYSSWGNTDRLNDLNKALCFLTGTQNEVGNIDMLRKDENGQKMEFNTWYDWGFFQIKGFKKGTLHCKFKDEKVWEQFNRRVSEIKGYPLSENVSLL